MPTKVKGFTMIEMIIVMVILGVVAAIAVPRYLGKAEESNVGEVLQNFGALKSAALACMAVNTYGMLCNDRGELDLDIRNPGKFVYRSIGGANAEYEVEATRNGNVLCMYVNGTTGGVTYYANPVNSIYAPMLKKVGTWSISFGWGCGSSQAAAPY